MCWPPSAVHFAPISFTSRQRECSRGHHRRPRMWRQSGGTIEVFCEFVGTGTPSRGSRIPQAEKRVVAC